MSDQEPQEKDRRQYFYNLTLTAVVGQVGCITLLIVFGALIGGLWLDRHFSTKPMFTLLFMVASMPVTLYIMYKVVKGATDKMRPVIKNKNNENSEGGSES